MDSKDVQSLIRLYIRQYVVMDEAALRLAAAYAQATWVCNRFDVVPPLVISGEKGTGKSCLAGVLRDVAFNAQWPQRTFKATLRHLNRLFFTLCVDQHWAGVGGNEEKRYLRLLELGQKKGAVWSWRTVRKDRSQEVENFLVFGPKVMVCETGVFLSGYGIEMPRGANYLVDSFLKTPPARLGAWRVLPALLEWHRESHDLPATFEAFMRELMEIETDYDELVNTLNLGFVKG